MLWHWHFRHTAHGSVSGTAQGKIQMWDVATGYGPWLSLRRPTEQENLGRISALAFSPDGALLVAGTQGHIHLWEVDTAHKRFSIKH